MSQQFCLKWNNHINMIEEFKHFLSVGIMVDVTLACDGQILKAHKIVLSACSPYFKSLFLENPCKHPIVILKDVKYTELKAVIDFMYRGEVNVEQDKLSALIKTAQTLKVKGLGEELLESQNDRCSYKYENQSDDEYDNQSEDELSNLSVCTLDVNNEKCGKKRTVTDQSENYEPEIKQELFDDTNHSASYPNTVTIPLQPHNSNFCNSQQEQLVEQSNDKCAVEENFQDSMQNLVGQSDSFPGQLFESSTQSNIQQHQNCPDSPSSSIAETSVYVYPSNTLTDDNQNPGTPSVPPHESLQKKEELEVISTKKSAKEIPSRKSVRQLHKLKKLKVISHNESNSGEVIEKIKDSGIAICKTKFHKCSLCTFKSLDLKSLKRHYRVAAHEDTGQFQSNKSTCAATSKSQLVQNVESVHQKEKSYQCSFCTYKAARAGNLKKHIESIHEGKKPFKCGKCDFHTAANRCLERHMIAVHEKKKQFACPHCSYQSHRIEGLNAHLKLHWKKK